VSEAQLLKSDTEGNFRILKSDDLVIGGYASIEIVDKQNDLITLKALEEAVNKYMTTPKYRNVMSNHSNVQVGDVIEKYRDKNGNLHQTQVDDVGFYVVIKLRDDIEKAKEIQRGIRKGTLRSFSIGGQALSKRQKTSEDLGQYNEIDKLELHEVTICEKGINPEAKFDILKEEKSSMTEKLEKALEELNGLMAEVNNLKKEEEEPMMDDVDVEEQMNLDEEDMEYSESGDEYDGAKSEDMDTERSDSDEDDVEHSNFDNYAKGKTGPEGFVEDGRLPDHDSTAKKHPQGAQMGQLYKEWTNEDFSTLDLSVENVEKAYDAFKAEQLEKMAYDSLKSRFEERFVKEQNVRKSAVARNEYDAKNEVEELKKEFTLLRKSLSAQSDEIVKAQTQTIDVPDVSEMSWGEIHNFISEFEN
jgi:HK97 family phage prohead protease